MTPVLDGLRERAAPLLAIATGALLLRLVATGAHTSYVKASTGWLLVTAGVVLLVAGGSALLPDRSGPHEHGHDHDHDHDQALPRAAALLLLPLGLLVLVSPPSLGVFYAQHAGSSTVATGRPGDEAPLAGGPDTPAELSLRAAVRRAEVGSTLTGRPVGLTGFVAGTDAEGRALLTRFNVRCCAADATPVRLAVALPGDVPADGTWLRVVAVWEGSGAVFRAQSAEPVDEPADPYEV